MHDLVIVGGGPAGIAAGIYSARKKLKTLLVTDYFGGQSVVSAEIQNFIGIKSISGFDLAKALEDQLRSFEDVEIVDSDRVSKVEKKDGGFSILTEAGKQFETRTVLVASGSRRRKLDIPGEREFEGRGVAYCSTCDAPIFKDRRVAVVGGGNAGLEAVLDLMPYAKEIFLLEYTDKIKGDPVTLEKIEKAPQAKKMTMVKVLEILGGKTMTGIRYRDRRTDEIKQMDLDGVFVEIGWVPNSDIVKDLVALNNRGEIIVDHKTQISSLPGIWAAGDVCDVLYKQNNVSIGDAIKAVLNIYEYLNKAGIEDRISN